MIKVINGMNTTRLSLTDLIEYFQGKKGGLDTDECRKRFGTQRPEF